MTEHNPFDGDNDNDDTFEVDEDSSTLAEGDYIAKLIEVEKAQSKKGNSMFVWTFHIIEDMEGQPVAGTPEAVVYTALSDKAMWKLEETLGALGLGKAENGRVKAKFSRSDAVGRYCVVTMADEEYNGRTSSKIKSTSPHPKGAGYRGGTDL